MKIPCFVITFKRNAYLRKCIESLLPETRLDIIVVDNCPDNSAKPTTDMFGVKYIAVEYNAGHRVVWTKQLCPTDMPYIVTDCDITVPHKLPWLDLLLQGLKIDGYNKVGLGLNVRHIPDTYPRKAEAIKHETRTLYRRKIADTRFVEMPVDTTLALYRSGYKHYSVWGTESNQYTGVCKSLRTVAQFEAMHLTWQEPNPDKEQYINSILPNSTHWSK
jgi:hypothetical protein